MAWSKGRSAWFSLILSDLMDLVFLLLNIEKGSYVTYENENILKQSNITFPKRHCKSILIQGKSGGIMVLLCLWFLML